MSRSQISTYLATPLFKVCLFSVVALLHAGNLRVHQEAAEDEKLGPQESGAG